MAKYHVIFRTCDVVHSVHNAPRPFGLDKRGIIKLSFLSLLDALKPVEHEVHVLGDKLSDEILQFFAKYPVTVSNGVFGNDESIRESIRQAVKIPDGDWVYFCEDDYLHTPDAFTAIEELLANKEQILAHRPKWRVTIGTKLKDRPLVIHPPDYPDRYRHKFRRASFLFVSPHHHWRQTDMTTFTFLMESGTVRRFERLLMHAAKGANDKYLSRNLYFGGDSHGKALCLSPVPGVASHLHEGAMTPVIDWQKIYEKYKHKL